jgi:hypothetical protein
MTREALAKRLRLGPEIVQYYWKSSTRFGFHPVAGAILLIRSLRRGFWPSEAFTLGLLNPDRGRSLMDVHISKRVMVKIQRRLNPPAWEHMLRDKAIFYRYCQAAGLPVPALAAIFIRGGRGWSVTTPAPVNDTEWGQFLEHDCPSPFIVKPSLGCHGKGILILTRTPKSLLTPDGRQYTGAALVEFMQGNPEYDSFVIQERLRNHPALAPVIAAEGLSTSRMITLFSPGQGCRLLNADLKIVMGDNLTSNFNMGATGNLAARVSIDTGRIENVVATVDGEGLVEVERHPDTGVPFRGFAIPDWESACRLVLRAAESFLPVRTIGWDVAFTPSGPVLIEGNFFFDPPNSTSMAYQVHRTLRDSLKTPQ